MNVDVLAALIDQKCDVLEQLRELAVRQAAFVAQGDMERLLTVLVAKQQLLSSLQEVETRLEPFRAEDPEHRVWRSPDQRQRTRQAAERCEQLLRETLELEQRCEAELVRRRDHAALQLQGVHSAARTRDAYVRAPAGAHGSLDLSSET